MQWLFKCVLDGSPAFRCTDTVINQEKQQQCAVHSVQIVCLYMCSKSALGNNFQWKHKGGIERLFLKERQRNKE